ncbi:MAG: type II toxin-antitoxin system HicA family toxin [Candidatus Methylomirabilales bacterium]
MRLPRDLSGAALAAALRRYGYEIMRQTGSHVRLTSTTKGAEHHITIPRHEHLRVGTLSGILHDVARYLEITRETLVQDLFGR